MTDIDKLLEKARGKAVDYGKLRGRKESASERLKGVAADLRDEAPIGLNIPDTDAWVRRHPRHKQAVKDLENDWAEWTTAEIYMRLLFAEKDVYQTECANNRIMDVAHR